MITHNNLYSSICSFSNLLKSWKQARKGKRLCGAPVSFEIEAEKELHSLREELCGKTYRPGRYREFFIHEPKKRMISAAPFRDRIVHHALCNIIEPFFEKKFIYDSYANRKEKGTHRAIKRFQYFSRKKKYVLQCDIKKFFPSIDHAILKSEISRTISCKETLWLFGLIIDNSNEQEQVQEYYPGDTLFTAAERRHGIPIGNLTSQFSANIYLNPLDHFIKEQLQSRYYVRYADDFAIFDDDKALLREWRTRITEFLDRRRLSLHLEKPTIFPVELGRPFLGQRIFPEFRLLKKEGIVRAKRRLASVAKDYASGEINLENVRQSIHGWLGHACQADTFRLRTIMMERLRF